MASEELDKAIGAHGMWKTRLKRAIDTGRLDDSPDSIRQDGGCAFGKWLHGSSLTAADKSSVSYWTVRDLHTQFHRVAARVAELAIAGQRAEAEKMMSLTGEFTAISGKLTAAMMEWRKAAPASG